MITKAELSKGTTVELTTPHPRWGSTVIVKDLMDRKSWNKPTRIGVGPADRGIAFGVELDRIARVVS